MKNECFLDTNILLYAATTSPNEFTKKQTAEGIFLFRDYALSSQVLQEFYVNAKRVAGIDQRRVIGWIELFMQRRIMAIDMQTVGQAIDISQQFQISYWDGAIIAAAQNAGAEILYSEDLSHGQIYGSIRVCNPFKEDFLAFQ